MTKPKPASRAGFLFGIMESDIHNATVLYMWYNKGGMIWNPFSASSKNFLGVDIGTSAVKIVELSKMGNRKKLENYGEMQSSLLYEKPFRTFEKSTLTVTSNDVVRTILAILKEAKIKASKACFSIPDFFGKLQYIK